MFFPKTNELALLENTIFLIIRTIGEKVALNRDNRGIVVI